MNKIQKIVLLFLVCHYTILGSLPNTGEELIPSTDINYGKWLLEDGEVTDEMKNAWNSQRNQSAAYRAKAGILEGIKGQKPDGNILVVPLKGNPMVVFRSSIYPLGHIYRAYDSQDLADILLGKEKAILLKITNFFHDKFAQITIKIPKLTKKIEDKKSKEEQLKKVTDIETCTSLERKIKSLQSEISSIITKINKFNEWYKM